MLPVILITRPPPPSANAVLHQPPAGIPFTFCCVAASIFESQCLCLPNFSFALRCGAHTRPDFCVITVKKTSILVPSLTQQNKGVQPDCLKLLELPSQRVGQDAPFRPSPFHFTLPDSFGYLEDRRLSRPSSKEAFGWFVAAKKPDLVAILPQSPSRSPFGCLITAVPSRCSQQLKPVLFCTGVSKHGARTKAWFRQRC